MSGASPYRGVSRTTVFARTRVRYFPCFGAWPMLLLAVFALPLAYFAHPETRAPSVVTCATLGADNGRPCVIRDGEAMQPTRSIACPGTPDALASFLVPSSPLARVVVRAGEVDVPDPRAGAIKCTDPEASPVTAMSAVDPVEIVDADAARKRIGACAFEPRTSGPPRIVSVSVTQIDYAPTAAILVAASALAILLALRRRVLVELLPEGLRVRVVERGYFTVLRAATVELARVAEVVLATEPRGIFNGTRAELVLRDGGRLPLTQAFAVLTPRVHARAARRLAQLLARARAETIAASAEMAPSPPPRTGRSSGRALALALAILGMIAGVSGFGAWRRRVATHAVNADHHAAPAGLARVGRALEGSTVVIASWNGRRYAIVADEDARALRFVGISHPLADAPPARSHEEAFDLPLSSSPGAMALDARGRLFVTLPRESAVVVLEAAKGKGTAFQLSETARVATAAEPLSLAMTPDDASLVVLSAYGHALETFRLDSLARTMTVDVPRSPRAMVLAEDGRRVFIAHDTGSRLSVVELSSGAYTPVGLDVHGPSTAYVPGGPGEFGTAPGKLLPTLHVRIARAGDRLFLPGVVVATGDSTVRPTHEYYSSALANGFDVSEIDTAAPVHTRSLRDRVYGRPAGLVYHEGHLLRGKPSAGATPLSCLLPSAALVDSAQSWLYVACAGPGRVFKVDVSERARCYDQGAWGAAYDVGDGPTGLALDEPDRVLFVWSQFAETLTALPLDAGMDLGRTEEAYPGPMVRETPRAWVRALPPVARDDQAALVARGRDLFMRTEDPRISSTQYGAHGGAACASCHIDGRDDALTWPTSRGPRRTVALAGRVEGTAPYGRSGEHATLADHVRETLERLGGTGLPSSDIDALVAYVVSLPPPPASRGDEGTVARGRALFYAAGCPSCHAPESGAFTDGRRHDVKSRTPIDSAAEFDTPSLLFIGGAAPYFHDGRYATLNELLTKTAGKMGDAGTLRPDEQRDLISYLESIGSSRVSSADRLPAR